MVGRKRRQKEFAFVVRLWAEDDPSQEAAWRGQIEHVKEEGKIQYFKGLQQLLKIIRKELGELRPAATVGGRSGRDGGWRQAVAALGMGSRG